MLDKTSFKILNFINANNKTSIEQLRSEFSNLDSLHGYIKNLMSEDYIEGLTIKYAYPNGFYAPESMKPVPIYLSPYQITPKGKAYLESVHEKAIQRKQENKFRKKELRHDYIVAVISAIVSAIISNIDRIVEFISEIKF